VIATDSVLARLRELLPGIEASAERCERERSVPVENMRLLREAGVFKLFQPRRYGGLESDLQTFFDVISCIGSACASTGWVAGVLGTHQFMAANFSEQAQDDVWRDTPESVVSITATPGSSTATAVEGGYVVNGTWKFASGSKHAAWHLVGATIGSAVPERAFFLLPVADVSFRDTWYVGGLCGTGSDDVVIESTFVPAHRMLKQRDVLEFNTPGMLVNTAPLYRIALASVIALGIIAPIVGATSGALSKFIETTLGRRRSGGVMGDVIQMAQSPVVQREIAEAAGLVDAATALLSRDLAETENAVRNGGMSVDLRVRNRRDGALAVRLCAQVMATLYEFSGSEALYTPNALERTWRDVNAATKHIGLNWDHIGTMAGRQLFGEEPRGQH
jgi:resorcinol 4-hydroxylase (FADH2)